MNAKEFANGLFKLAEQHKNDHRTIFDTDWNLICTEAGNYILELQRQIDEMASSNEAWVEWYEKERLKERETHEEKEVKPISIPDFFNVVNDERRED